jgi:hypothetical protein
MLALVLLMAAAPEPGIDRAVAYLTREVPRWQRENHCASCHNNGDGARALYTARRLGYRVASSALATTTAWLEHPGQWDANRGNPAFSDKNLARIQFAASLVEAFDAGVVRDRSALVAAANSLLDSQQADGSWHVDAGAAVGSPVTYGPYLATHMARRALQSAARYSRDDRFATPIARATDWFAAARPTTILDRAVVILAIPERVADPADPQLAALLEARNPDGGWGPFRHAPSEPFDTAVVLLALDAVKERAPQARAAIAGGRAWLLKSQLDSGDWPETTRPAGLQSYAQHVSTAAWAASALILTAQRGTWAAGRTTGGRRERDQQKTSP